MLKKPHTFKTIEGRTVAIPGQVQTSPVLDTFVGKCRLRKLHMHIVPDEDTAIRNGAACSGEIVLGNTFFLHAGLSLTDFVADKMDRLSSIDYGNINTTSDCGKIGKLGSELLGLNSLQDDQLIATKGGVSNLFPMAIFHVTKGMMSTTRTSK